MLVEILKKLISEYTEISRLTERISTVELDEQLQLIEKRDTLIENCHTLFTQKQSHCIDSSDHQIKELELQLSQLILSVVAQDELNYGIIETQKKEIREQLPMVADRHRAANGYQLHSRRLDY